MSRWLKILMVCLLGSIGLPSWPGLQLAAAQAEPVDAPLDAVAPPTQITADTMTYDMKKQQAHLVGNVEVVDKGMTLKADLVVVTFDKKNQPQYIDASGHVVINSSDGIATAGKGSYDVVAQRVVLTDTPVLHKQGSRIRDAEKVIFDRKQEKFTTEGGRPVLEFVKSGENDAALDKLIGKPDKNESDDKGGAGNR